jgi:uncharacterized protein (TIGR02996 family)
MTRDEAFLRDICEHPADDTLRLIYADWLEEHGSEEAQARAQFIRLQIARAPLSRDSPQFDELLGKEKPLRRSYGSLWWSRLPKLKGIGLYSFQRGFVPGASVERWRSYRTQAHVMFASAPIQELAVLGLSAEVCEELVKSPYLARLTSLRLPGWSVGDRGVRALARCPHLGQLRSLSLYGGRTITDTGALALASAPHLGRLIHLDVRESAISEQGVLALAERFGEQAVLWRR